MKLFAPRRLRAAAAAALACAAPVITACNSYSLSPPEVDPISQSDRRRVVNAKRELDILFMIDDSASMEQEQANLSKNFEHFMRELETIEGGLPDVRIGVVTSNVGASGLVEPVSCQGLGDAGRFQVDRVLPPPAPGKPSVKTMTNCGLSDGAKFIWANDRGASTNLVPGKSLTDVFSCLAERGIGFCGFEHQLESVRRALTPRADQNPGNLGFIRPGAHLAIVIITDEDDCSGPEDAGDFYTSPRDGQAASYRCATEGHVCNGQAPPASGAFSASLEDCAPSDKGRLLPIPALVEQIKAQKPGAEDKIIVSAIAGWPLPGQGANPKYAVGPVGETKPEQDILPICKSANGAAAPALRINKFVKSFGDRGQMYSICQDDFSPVLREIGKAIGKLLQPSCLEKPVADRDPAPGVQPECVVTERRKTPGGTADRLLPACGPGVQAPCWKLVPDETCGGRVKYEIDRAGETPPPDTEEIVKCLTCAEQDDPSCASR
jgi:hypothetical protein